MNKNLRFDNPPDIGREVAVVVTVKRWLFNWSRAEIVASVKPSSSRMKNLVSLIAMFPRPLPLKDLDNLQLLVACSRLSNVLHGSVAVRGQPHGFARIQPQSL
ncbi:MAG: hypothetical protein KatS3mg015_0971 [Fimbriimonadales bacterium]|nr:MAG: hypothetical protein KatS3mg015_0971 [Fimbriimonadales bacterium]